MKTIFLDINASNFEARKQYFREIFIFRSSSRAAMPQVVKLAQVHDPSFT